MHASQVIYSARRTFEGLQWYEKMAVEISLHCNHGTLLLGFTRIESHYMSYPLL